MIGYKHCKYCGGTGMAKCVTGYAYENGNSKPIHQSIYCPVCKMRDDANLLRIKADAMSREADSMSGGRV